jgi:hypothetical protein
VQSISLGASTVKTVSRKCGGWEVHRYLFNVAGAEALQALTTSTCCSVLVDIEFLHSIEAGGTAQTIKNMIVRAMGNKNKET